MAVKFHSRLSLSLARELSEEEKQMLMLTEEFHQFFDRTTRIVERVLGEDRNIFVDYSHDHEDEEGGSVFNNQCLLWVFKKCN